MRGVATTLALKYAIVAGLSLLILPAVGRVAWPQALWIALVVAAASHGLGDRLVLPAAGSAGAVVADFALGVALFWAAPFYAPHVRLPFGGALVAGGAVALAEILYHQFLLAPRAGVR